MSLQQPKLCIEAMLRAILAIAAACDPEHMSELLHAIARHRISFPDIMPKTHTMHVLDNAITLFHRIILTGLCATSMSAALSRMYKALELWTLVEDVDDDATIGNRMQYMASMADEWQQKIQNLMEQLQLLVPCFSGTLRLFNKRDSEIPDDQSCSSDDKESDDDSPHYLRSERLSQASRDELNCANANEDLAQAYLTVWSTPTRLDQAFDEYDSALVRLSKCELSDAHRCIRDDCVARGDVTSNNNMLMMIEILSSAGFQDNQHKGGIPASFFQTLQSYFNQR